MGETYRVETETGQTGAEAPTPDNQHRAMAPAGPGQTPTETPAEPAPAPEPAPQAAPAETGELILGKYRTNEDVQAALLAAQRKISELSQGKAPAEEAQEAAEAVAGLNLQPYFDEYAQAGTLSEQSYGELESLGIDRGTVGSYIAGQEASQDAMHNRLKDEVGGDEAFQTMFEWAGADWDVANRQVFNQAVNSGQEESIRLALSMLKRDYETAHGQAPEVELRGSNPTHPGTAPYASQAEMVAGVRDPRYKTDPAYRAVHEARVAGMREV